MKLQIVRDEKELSRQAAELVQTQLALKSESVLLFPTGNTPLGMFEELIGLYQQGLIHFSKSKLLELDEYQGIFLNDPRNLFAWLQRVFISQVDYLPENTFRFYSDAKDVNAEIQSVERTLERLGTIDLLMLGLGPNGHIGFNEPGSTIDSKTRVVSLSKASQLSNSRYWDPTLGVPKSGFTLGIGTILQARKIVLLVQGKSKAEILRETLYAPISSQIPATFLRKKKNLLILADEDAASLLDSSPLGYT